MNRPLIALAGLIVAGGTAGGVLILASPGGEEEAVQEVDTATPSSASSGTPAASIPALPTLSPTVPADLPPPGGYVWFVKSLASDQPLAGYAIQIPVGWLVLGGGLSNPEAFAPQPGPWGVRPVPGIELFVRPPSATLPHAWDGNDCGEAADAGTFEGDVGAWNLFNFSCFVEGGTSFSARGAESQVGESQIAIVAYGASPGLDETLETVLNSFTPR